MNRLFLALVAIAGVGSVASAQAQVAGKQCVVRDDQSSLCVNDRILDDRNMKGTITQIYSDFSGVVTFDNGQTNLIDLQYASREVSCVYGFCAGDAVTASDDSNSFGRVTDVFENGVAEVNFENDTDGQLDYVELNNLTSVQGDSVEASYPWGAPRPFPDYSVTYSYAYFSAPPLYPVYYYPVNYSHRPTFGRVLRAIFPPRPIYVGYHRYEPYPYRGVGVQWGFHVRVRAPEFNRHIGFEHGIRQPGFPGRPNRGGFGGGFGGRGPVVIRPAPHPIPGPYNPPRGGFGGGDHHEEHHEEHHDDRRPGGHGGHH